MPLADKFNLGDRVTSERLKISGVVQSIAKDNGAVVVKIDDPDHDYHGQTMSCHPDMLAHMDPAAQFAEAVEFLKSRGYSQEAAEAIVNKHGAATILESKSDLKPPQPTTKLPNDSSAAPRDSAADTTNSSAGATSTDALIKDSGPDETEKQA